MEAIKISLDDYILTGGGANGESFDCKSDPSVMLKLYFPGKMQQATDELLMSKKVHALGIPTPEPGDYVVTEDGRHGIRFRRIAGKKSFSRATADDPGNVERYASEFAQMCLQLHSTHLDVKEFENGKTRYINALAMNPFFTKSEKDKLERFITDIPDSDTALHGDLQYSNAIFAQGKRYFIDLGDFCYGYNLFDIGMVYLCCCLSDESFITEIFHMKKSLSTTFWKYFAQTYFGADRPLKDIEAQVLPYAGLKTIFIERDMNMPMPEFRAALGPILK